MSHQSRGGEGGSGHLARPRAISTHRHSSRASDEQSARPDPPAAESEGSARDKRAPDPHPTPSPDTLARTTHARTRGVMARIGCKTDCSWAVPQQHGPRCCFEFRHLPATTRRLTGTLTGTHRGPRTHAPPRAAVPSATWCVGTRCAAALGFQISDCAITWRGGGGTTRGSLTHSARATCRPSLTQHVPRVGALSPVELDFVVSATEALDD